MYTIEGLNGALRNTVNDILIACKGGEGSSTLLTQLAPPFQNICFPSHPFVPPPFKVYQTVPSTLTQPPPALI